MSVPPPRDRRWGGPTHAAAIRVVTLLVWALIVATTPYAALAEFPPDRVSGFGLGRLLLEPTWLRGMWLREGTLVTLQILAGSACVVGLVSSRARGPALWVAFVTVLVLDAVLKSVGGFANHAQVLPLLVLGLVAWYGGQITERANRRLVWLVALAAVLPYTFIGVQRLLSGGLDLFMGNALLQYLSAGTRAFVVYPSSFDPLALRPLLNAGFLGITILETTAAGLLVSRSYRVVWLVSMGLFHVSTLFLMNILFWENLLITSVVFWWGWRPVEFSRDQNRLRRGLIGTRPGEQGQENLTLEGE